MPHPIISVPKNPTIAVCGQRNCHKQRRFKKQEIGRTWWQTQTNMGADANADGSRCGRGWGLKRMRMGADANAHCPAFADKYRFQISESTSIWP